MLRYSISLSNTKYPLKVRSKSDNHVIGQPKYLQLLGFSKSSKHHCNCISFWELSEMDLNKLLGYHPVLLKSNGLPKILASTVISIDSEVI